MLRGIVFTLLLCLQPSAALTQLVREHDGQGLRSFHGQTSRIRRSFQSDAEARAVFKYILAVSGLAGMEDQGPPRNGQRSSTPPWMALPSLTAARTGE